MIVIVTIIITKFRDQVQLGFVLIGLIWSEVGCFFLFRMFEGKTRLNYLMYQFKYGDVLDSRIIFYSMIGFELCVDIFCIYWQLRKCRKYINAQLLKLDTNQLHGFEEPSENGITEEDEEEEMDKTG